MPTTRLTFYQDSEFGAVLRTAENLVDGTTITFANGPLFRVICRNPSTGGTLTLEPGPATQVPVASVSDPIPIDVGGDPGFGTPDNLGQRSSVGVVWTFGPFPDGTFLLVFWGAALLDSQPDRPRFSVWCFWTSTTSWSVEWAAPIVMQLDPFPQDQYFIGCNGGLVTRAPQTDLRGDNDTYRFAAAMRFEPEENYTDVDQMDAFYPGPLGMDVTGYGSRSTRVNLLEHGNCLGVGARARDYFDGTSIILGQEVLVPEASRAGNDGQIWGLVGSTIAEAHRYISFFKSVGDVMGEELAFNWRTWFLSSYEGKQILPARPRDRANMARLTKYPLWLEFDPPDLEGDTGVTQRIADEYRALFPTALTSDLPRYPRKLLDFSQQDNSASHPSLVLDSVQDLFDLASDPEKRDYMNVLRANKSMFTVGRTKPRRPTPYDGNNYWDNYDGAGSTMDTTRVKSWKEATLAVYKSTAQWLASAGVVFDIVVSGGFTFLKLSSFFDKTHWELYETYPLGSHATHQQHLGVLVLTHLGTPYYYTIERQNQTLFNAGYIPVAGDITALASNGDSMLILWMGDHMIPGLDRTGANQISGVGFNSICSYADDYGSGNPSPTKGPLFRFRERIETLYSEYAGADSGAGLVLEDAMKNPVCHSGLHSHIRGGNHQLVGWRNVLSKIRSVVEANNGGQWELFQDAQPIEYLLGMLDGTSQTWRKMALTTSKGSWGLSPFMVTALGDFMRTGFYDNSGLGHISGATGKALYAAYEAAGVSGFVREALLADWLYCRKLISIGHLPGPAGVLGATPTGDDAYTPFNHEAYGSGLSTSIAAMMARMVQAQIAFTHANFHGQGMRSLERLGGTFEASARGLLGYDGHDIGSQETGANRSHLMHAVVADGANRRKIIVFIGNPSLVQRGDSFRFKPAWFRGLVPGRVGAYRVTRYDFAVDGWTTTDLGIRHGNFEIVEQLQTSQFVAYTFEFVSGLRFKHRYDDEAFTEIDMAPEQTHMRIEPIQGQGARFQFGFVNDHPDEPFELASIELRTFLMGRSKNR